MNGTACAPAGRGELDSRSKSNVTLPKCASPKQLLHEEVEPGSALCVLSQRFAVWFTGSQVQCAFVILVTPAELRVGRK